MAPSLPPQITKKEEDDEKNQLQTHHETYARYRDIISTLPSLPGGSHSHLYRHADGWYASMSAMIGVLATRDHFRARTTDILLSTFPKSGTTWLKALLFATVTRVTHPDTPTSLSSFNPHELIPFLESQVYTNERVPDLERLSAPRLFSTHIPFQSLPETVIGSESKIIYLCRGAKDNFVSLWHFVNKIREKDGKDPLSLEVALEQFCSGVTMFGPYWDHVVGYWKGHVERPHQVLFLKYEQVKGDPVSQLKRLAKFIGHGFTADEEREGVLERIVEMCGLESLANLEVNKGGRTQLVHGPMDNSLFFRRGVVGDWANHLSPDMAQRIDEISESTFQGSGLTF